MQFYLLDIVAVKDYQSEHYGKIGRIIAFAVHESPEGDVVRYAVEFDPLDVQRFYDHQLTHNTETLYHRTLPGLKEFVERSGRKLDQDLLHEGGHDYEWINLPPVTYEMDGTE